jgi:hypothetical protein
MTHRYTEVSRGGLEWDLVSYAERVLDAAREQLDLIGTGVALGIRWYVASEQADDYFLTRFGRNLDIDDERPLAGWYRDPAVIAVRADLPLADIGLTTAHEVYHAFEDHHDRPLNEAAAEDFARRLVARLKGAIR